MLPFGFTSRMIGGGDPVSVILHTWIAPFRPPPTPPRASLPPPAGAAPRAPPPRAPGSSSSSPPPPPPDDTSQPFDGSSRKFPPGPLMTARGLTLPLSVLL